MTTIQELYKAVAALAYAEGRNSHGSHRYDHAPADCRYCLEWTLKVVEVAILADQVLYPLLPVREELLRLQKGE